MNLRLAMAAPLTALALALAACGGSSHSSTSSASTAATSTPSSSSSTTSAQSAASSSTSLTTSTTRPPEVPRSRYRLNPHRVAPASGVRVPASFTIQHGGPLTPAVISVPTGVTIELQARNLDSHGHSIRVDAPAARTVSVSPGASASASVTGLANGSYRVLEDGRAGARIVVGSQPGP